MSSSSVTGLAAAAVLAMLLISGTLVLTTGLRVEDSGPVIVYGVALVSVLLLLFAPTRSAR